MAQDSGYTIIDSIREEQHGKFRLKMIEEKNTKHIKTGEKSIAISFVQQYISYSLLYASQIGQHVRAHFNSIFLI